MSTSTHLQKCPKQRGENVAEGEQVQGAGGAPWLPHETTEGFPYRAPELEPLLVTSADSPLCRVQLFLHTRFCCHGVENEEGQLPSIYSVSRATQFRE